jgi:pimeloyl-ACP methyl ester carboxylesterase
MSPVSRPVVVVHGWNGGPEQIEPVVSAVKAAAQAKAMVLTFDYSSVKDNWAGDSEISGCLARYLDLVSQIWTSHGGDGKLIAIGYSMGGLAIRYAADKTVDGRSIGDELAGVITLDTPHRGSNWGGTVYALGQAWWTKITQLSLRPLPDPGKDGAACLAHHSGGSTFPDKCGPAPPYLPAAAKVHQIDGAVTVQRRFWNVTMYSFRLNGDSVVSTDSQQGYGGSGPTGDIAGSATSASVGCTVNTNELSLDGFVLQRAVDGEAQDDIHNGRVSLASADLLLDVNDAAQCSHTRMPSNPKALGLLTDVLTKWLSEIKPSLASFPLWIQRLNGNPIVPGRGLAGVRLGDSESAVIKALGEPSQIVPITAQGGQIIQYAVMYHYQGIFLGLYSDPHTRTIHSIRLSDDDFNKLGLIPQVRPGAGIGVTSSELVGAMGQPITTDEHFTCPRNLPDVKTTTYRYPGVEFWVCTNDQVFLIDL